MEFCDHIIPPPPPPRTRRQTTFNWLYTLCVKHQFSLALPSHQFILFGIIFSLPFPSDWYSKHQINEFTHNCHQNVWPHDQPFQINIIMASDFMKWGQQFQKFKRLFCLSIWEDIVLTLVFKSKTCKTFIWEIRWNLQNGSTQCFLNELCQQHHFLWITTTDGDVALLKVTFYFIR